MRLKNIIPFPLVCAALTAAIACGCSKKTGTVHDAIIDKIVENNPEVEYFAISKLETVSTVTLGDELSRRRRIFEANAREYRKRATAFSKQRKPKNAAIMMKQCEEAEAVVERIGAYGERHADRSDSVLYYVFKLDGYGFASKKAKVEAKGYYATVKSDGTVVAVIPPGGNPMRGMGLTIPGYRDSILRSASEGEEKFAEAAVKSEKF